MQGNKPEKNDGIESLDDTMIFNVEPAKNTKEINVIKEKSLVVDFTSPVDVLSDDLDDKKKKKKGNKKKNKKLKFKLFSNIKNWWSGLTKLKKFVICFITFLVITLIVLLVLVLTKKKDDKKEKLPDVVIQQENYTYKNGVLIFTDESKKEIGKYECKNKDEKKCYIAYRNEEDNFIGDQYLDQDGNKIKSRASIINEDYVFVVDNKSGSNDDIILYSIKSKNSIDEYKLVKQSSINKNNVILKNKENKYGMLDLSDTTPRTLINFVYDYAGAVANENSNKYLVINKNRKYYLIDFEENLLSSGFNDEIVDYNDNFIVTKSSDNYYKIFNFEGTELTPNTYLFIKIMGDYYAALLDNGIIVYDKTGLKYNEVPIGLTSTNYNRTYVFDANNQLISNDVAFEMEVNEEYISISRGKANDLLSIKEAQENKDRPFVSYFNGILYFYGDDKKTNLIGKYTCKNRNSTGVLDHCTVASTTNISNNDLSYDIQTGILSILNNRYVFINDTITTPSIYLYDLSVNKKLGPYTAVETSGLIGHNFDAKVSDGDYIVVKNTKDQFGLLRVTSTSVDVVLNFEFSELEKSGDNFIAKKSNGKYVIFGKDGKEKCKDIPEKIMSYTDKYITAKSSSGYKVYDYEGKEIDGKGYTYVRLYANCYAAVVANKTLEIHEYSKPNAVIKMVKGNETTPTDILVNASDSWKTDKSFTVTKTGEKYYVKVNDVMYESYVENTVPKNEEQNNNAQEDANNNENNNGEGN
ncbi:MAG: hypothetical protein J5634_02535 [Bacilli bacterium]|nr:hypothetical protein [Bacilli bacterium]